MKKWVLLLCLVAFPALADDVKVVEDENSIVITIKKQPKKVKRKKDPAKEQAAAEAKAKRKPVSDADLLAIPAMRPRKETKAERKPESDAELLAIPAMRLSK
ncbi:hypothetical protein EDC61_12046 [Sulfuritortus calidifontis]|uniref:Uncharacterized protein n=1 Tax=Sulfuritortus calidifontis TaxID=1914471 RepID=A0A4R3JTC3_9PROT|nr:hypothetical protein [Sulfuritortus calidifontis]TCS69485.1 hypothetical protein EDC61_12046 [Sulfuritortus calidifontis]